MRIKTHPDFKRDIREIVAYIAKNSPTNAHIFKTDLRSKIENIPHNPKAYRKNLQINKENTRDLIYKGYIVPFVIGKDTITILAIYKSNLWNPTQK